MYAFYFVQLNTFFSEGGKIVSPTHQPPLSPGVTTRTHLY